MTSSETRSASGSALATRSVTLRASLARRWAALIYEGFLLFALLMVSGFAVLPWVNPSAPVNHTAAQLYLLPTSSRAFLFFYYVAVTGTYFVGFWSNGRRTLAMKTWGLALARADGSPIDIRLATKRFAAGWIAVFSALAGYALLGRWGILFGLINHAWGWIDPRRQFLHDRLAGTQIVRG
ncbi:MAG: RDD family protein [Betaproteobacteria bacterium]